ATAAVARLAPDAVVERLGLPDGALTAVEERLLDVLAERCGPDTLVVAPWSADGHPDHDALGRAASGAAARSGATVAYYPVWLWHWGHPDDLPWEAVHAVELTSPDLARRAAAVDEYPSQTAPLGPGPGEAAVVTEPVLRRARRVVEALFAAPGALPLLAPRDDADVAAPFDAMCAGGPDPWAFEGSFYEERKRALTTAVLARPRYGSVVEIGCADGLLTTALAARAGGVVAIDVSPAALDLARARSLANVRWVLGRAPAAVPPGPTDLVMLSEVGYFLTPLELLETLRRVRRSLAEGGEVALVHWRHPTADVPLDGPAVHDQAASVLADLPHRVHHVDADVVIDVWGHPASVAEQEGRR
ncbi:MAG: class I SAM-dependent methyltransferase, partial [Ornithinibacter sp.]